MKYYIVACVALLYSLNISAQQLQEAEVPAIVLSNFKSIYGTTAIEPTWEKSANNHYKVAFLNNGKKLSGNYDGNGNLHQLSTHLNAVELPKSIKQLINDTYGKKYHIEHAIETQSFVRPATYEVVMLDKNSNTIKVLVDNKTLKVLSEHKVQ